MCKQVTELYAACKCLYYVNGVDQCPNSGVRGHKIQKLYVYVGGYCDSHRKPRRTQPWARSVNPRIVNNTNENSTNPLRTPDHHKYPSVTEPSLGAPKEDSSSDAIIGPNGEASPHRSGFDTASETYSVAELIFSDESDASSASSSSFSIPIFEHLPAIYAGDEHLVTVLGDFLEHTDEAYFVHCFSRLLKPFSSALENVAKTDLERALSKVIRRRTRYQSQLLYALINPDKSKSRDVVSNLYDHPIARYALLNRYLDGNDITAWDDDEDEHGAEYEPDFDHTQLDKLEDFMLKTPPIIALRESLCELTALSRIELPSSYQYQPSAFTLAWSSVQNIRSDLVNSFKRIQPNEGEKSFHWTCACGRRIKDSVRELRPNAVERFLKFHTSHSQDISSTERSFWSKLALPGMASIRRCMPGYRSMRGLQLPSSQDRTNTAKQYDTNTSESIPEFALLCFKSWSYKTILVQDNLEHKKLDRQIFESFHRHYSSWRLTFTRFLTLRSLKDIEFVRFHLYHGDKVAINTEDVDQIPVCGKVCPNGCGNGCVEGYRYGPCPLDMIPPIPKEMMKHYFLYPEHCGTSSLLRERIPKKLLEPVATLPHKPFTTGWGLRITTSTSWAMLFLVQGVFIVASVVFAIYWCSTHEEAIQDSFSVAGWLLTIGAMTTYILHSMAEVA